MASSSRSSSGPLGENRYQLIAGERRWRAPREAGLATIPALVEEIDDDTALEISIIENLQREDLSPLEEAAMYDRMVREHGYSIRKLAEKLGKDKGYLENRLRLADAPDEIRELVSLRKDTLSHAYELLKVAGSRRSAKRLAAQVAAGELSLVKLREKIEGRRTRPADRGRGRSEADGEPDRRRPTACRRPGAPGCRRWPTPDARRTALSATTRSSTPVTSWPTRSRSSSRSSARRTSSAAIPEVDRANLAKYLTIAKLKLENAIALVRTRRRRLTSTARRRGTAMKPAPRGAGFGCPGRRIRRR